MLTFATIAKYKPGQLAEIIRESYLDLLKESPPIWGQEERKWEEFDKNAFGNPAIGKCVFVTEYNGKPVGLASWDPRHWPEYGVIGQNCLLPKCRGMGIGTAQIQEVLRIFRQNKVKKAVVTTSEHPFFEPAQKMYKKLGFVEIRKKHYGPDPKYKVIDLERIL